MNEYDSFLTTISQKQRNSILKQPKFISAAKWQKYMVDGLKLMMSKYSQKKNLLTDLITIVNGVHEESFVQATLKIRPFKPEFQQAAPILATVTQSTLAETVTRHIKYSPCKLKHCEETKKRIRITQRNLTQQFDKDYHPFKFIIKNFKRLMELKFKSLIDNKKITTLAALLAEIKSDITIFSQFLHRASQPYKKLFKTTSEKGEQQQNNKFQQFVDTFIAQNQKLNKCIHKIFSYACKTLYKEKIDQKMGKQVDLQDFKFLPQEFKIDGCYIRTLSSLMHFAQQKHPQKAMKKLIEIRQNILIDISDYYLQRKQQKQLQVSAQVQIEIIRFCLAKLKDWATDIMASLRFLEYVHGEEEMGYKYEESSYMYTQLCMAFEVMELD